MLAPVLGNLKKFNTPTAIARWNYPDSSDQAAVANRLGRWRPPPGLPPGLRPSGRSAARAWRPLRPVVSGCGGALGPPRRRARQARPLDGHARFALLVEPAGEARVNRLCVANRRRVATASRVRVDIYFRRDGLSLNRVWRLQGGMGRSEVSLSISRISRRGLLPPGSSDMSGSALFDCREPTSAEATSSCPSLRPAVADRSDFAVRKPKNRVPEAPGRVLISNLVHQDEDRRRAASGASQRPKIRCNSDLG